MKQIILITALLLNILSFSQKKKPFPTGKKILPHEIIVRETNLDDTIFHMLYIQDAVKFGIQKENGKPSYWERIKGFRKVFTKTDLENFVIKKSTPIKFLVFPTESGFIT